MEGKMAKAALQQEETMDRSQEALGIIFVFTALCGFADCVFLCAYDRHCPGI